MTTAAEKRNEKRRAAAAARRREKAQTVALAKVKWERGERSEARARAAEATQKLHQAIVEALAAGASRKDVAAVAGISVQRVAQIFEERSVA